MGIFKVKLRATDRLWTLYIRQKYNYTCQWCGRGYNPDYCANFGTSHYFTRDHENVRFDEDNTFPLCNLPCHRYLDEEGRKEYEVFMLKRLGRAKFELLMLKAHIYKKRDDAADKIIIKALLEEQAKNLQFAGV